MALINCPDCNHEVSSSATACPKCGCPMLSDVCFFTATRTKLILMSLCTFGFYYYYWFYKNFQRIKETTGKNIWPFWRALFCPLMAYSCFKPIQDVADKNNTKSTINPVLLALCFFILGYFAYLPDPYWLIFYLSILIISAVNDVAIEVNERLIPDFKNNGEFSGWNWFGLIIGGIFWFLVILVLIVPEA